ncbi:hypothetical protein C3L33_08319, partial [Rhododendron williamsianum]
MSRPSLVLLHVSLQLSGYFLGMAGGATGLVLGSMSSGNHHPCHMDFYSISATCKGPQAQTYLELVPPSHRLLSSSLELGQHMGRLHHFEACKGMDDRIWFYLWCNHAYLANFRSLEEDDKRWKDHGAQINATPTSADNKHDQHMGRLHHFEACNEMDDRIWFYDSISGTIMLTSLILEVWKKMKEMERSVEHKSMQLPQVQKTKSRS